jgi:hypothetical protein
MARHGTLVGVNLSIPQDFNKQRSNTIDQDPPAYKTRQTLKTNPIERSPPDRKASMTSRDHSNIPRQSKYANSNTLGNRSPGNFPSKNIRDKIIVKQSDTPEWFRRTGQLWDRPILPKKGRTPNTVGKPGKSPDIESEAYFIHTKEFREYGENGRTPNDHGTPRVPNYLSKVCSNSGSKGGHITDSRQRFGKRKTIYEKDQPRNQEAVKAPDKADILKHFKQNVGIRKKYKYIDLLLEKKEEEKRAKLIEGIQKYRGVIMILIQKLRERIRLRKEREAQEAEKTARDTEAMEASPVRLMSKGLEADKMSWHGLEESMVPVIEETSKDSRDTKHSTKEISSKLKQSIIGKKGRSALRREASKDSRDHERSAEKYLKTSPEGILLGNSNRANAFGKRTKKFQKK